MKRTTSMIYKPSTESRELELYTENHSGLYKRMTLPIIKNLKAKKEKGTYDPERAAELWYHLTTEASKEYSKDFGYSFSVTDRWTVAVDLENYYRDEIDNYTF